MTQRIYLWAGPGAGKSTLAADIFQEGKRRGLSIELVREFAKEKVWRGEPLDQLELWAEQWRREKELLGKVDYIVTDSPWPMGYIYAVHYEAPSWFKRALRTAAFQDRLSAPENFIDVMVFGTKPYVQAGRNEDAFTARGLDDEAHAFGEELAGEQPCLLVSSDYSGRAFWDAQGAFTDEATREDGRR